MCLRVGVSLRRPVACGVLIAPWGALPGLSQLLSPFSLILPFAYFLRGRAQLPGNFLWCDGPIFLKEQRPRPLDRKSVV